MPDNKKLKVSELSLDLNNYRTVPQKSEEDAINAMITIKPEKFYAIIESIIENGYLLTENLIILQDGKYIVKEGNRRTAALKLIHGFHDKNSFNLPNSLKQKIESLGEAWKSENMIIPCYIFSLEEKEAANKIISLTHAKGEKAARDPWSSVARARQNRDEKKASEPVLDLLEKYIEQGQNLTNQQKERWSGDYHLTVLEEALRTITPRLGFNSISELVQQYPNTESRTTIEDVIRAIGLEEFGFKEIRDKHSDFAAKYGVPKKTPNLDSPSKSAPNNSSALNQKQALSESSSKKTSPKEASKPSFSFEELDEKAKTTPQKQPSKKKPKAHPVHDQKAVNQTLRKFTPLGSNRQKLVALRDELKRLKIKDNPHAFCFVLRSMFEISAKIYCEENSIPTEGQRGSKTLSQLLSAVTTHLTENSTNQGMVKTLHGANTELSKREGLLSVTSMNQLVHSTTFSIAPHDICTLFNNVYPLLEAMN